VRLGILEGGLRTKIITWSFVPTAIILVAVALVTFTAYQQVAEDLVIERDQELTRLSASRLATELSDYTNILAASARTTGTYIHPAVQRITLQRASERLAIFDGGVLVLDTFGTVVATEPARPEALGHNWSDRPYFSQMLNIREPVFSNILADGPGSAQVIVIAVPIIGPQDEFLGIVAGMLRLGTETASAFYGNIVKPQLGENGSAYLVDGNGNVIYHSDADRIGEEFSEQAVVQEALSGQVGAIRTRAPEGQDIVASFAPVPGTSWGLVTEESWAALTSPSRGYRQFLLLLLALGVLVPALVVAIAVNRITRPITELIGAAQAVAGGDFGQRITADTGDEVEELAKQFSLMSAQLQESYTNLEHRVADRTKELAALNAIAAEVSRSLDLQEILTDALDKTLEVVDIEAGGIYLLDEAADVLTIAVQRGFNPQFVAEVDNLRVGEGFSGRVIQSGQPLVVRDISTDPRLTRMAAREEGFHSLVSVPLISKGKALGALFAATYGYREFTDQDVQLLTSIGHQIGVAIDNAHLYEAERQRRQEATLLTEVARLISGTLDLDEVLRLTAECAIEVFEVDCCCIFQYDEQKGTLRPAVYIGFDGSKAAREQPAEVDQVPPALSEVEFTPSPRMRQKALEGLQPLMVEDVPSDPHLSPQHLLALQSVLVAPIEVGGRRLGAMQLGTQPPRRRRFTAEEGELALAMANQAAVAIDSARLFKDEQRRAEQFWVIGEVGRRITSILAIDELLGQMVGLIQEAFNYYLVEIGLVEEEALVFKARAGRNRGSQFESFSLKVDKKSITGWVAATGEPLRVPDVSQEPRYVKATDTETCSELAVPIMVKDKVTGVINVESDRLDAFDESDVAVLQSLAHQAAIAIQNASLFKAERRRAEQFRVISEVGRRITSILAVDELLGEIARLLKETLGYYLVGIALIEGDELIFRAGAGAVWELPDFRPPRLKVGQEGITGWVAQSGKPSLVPDVDQEPRYYSLPEASEIQSELAVPLETKEAVIGVLHVQSNRPNAFDESDMVILQSLADQAALVIENAQLYEQAQQVATLEERQRLARELHDSVTQALYGVTLYAEAAARLLSVGDTELASDHLREVRQTAQEALREMRLLIFELRPPVLEQEGLATALESRLEAVEGRSGLKTEFKVEGDGRLPPDIEEGLYRIAQEALNNALKHAQAQRITLHLRQENQAVMLEVADDGIGFDPTTAREQGGLGLSGMEERAEMLSGRLIVKSRPGEGTSVKVEVNL
jgi:GAF domain-containing protein/HAMP domain-containing protein